MYVYVLVHVCECVCARVHVYMDICILPPRDIITKIYIYMYVYEIEINSTHRYVAIAQQAYVTV